jgi:hypothetical protein
MKLIFSDGSACGRIRHGEAASADGIGSDGISEDRGETISQARCQQGNDNQRKQTQKTKGLLLC